MTDLVPLGAESAAVALRLLREAMHLRVHGEHAPGGDETWAAWDASTETFLRELYETPPVKG